VNTKRCTCGVTLPWALTKNGKRMLIEPKPGGNVVLQETLTEPEPIAMVVEPGAGTHQAHFASCPDADFHRRRGGATLPSPDQGDDDG
jgi:hypothetical protein